MYNSSVNVIPPKWNEELPISASEQYLSSISNQYGWFVQKNNSHEIYLAYAIKKIGFFNCIIFYSDISSIDKNVNIESNIQSCFLEACLDYAKNKLNCDVVLPSPAFVISKVRPEKLDVAPFGTFYIDLTNDESILWNNIHSKHRNVIRKAKSNSININFNADEFLMVLNFINNSQKRTGGNEINFNYWQKLSNKIPNNILIVTAKKNDEIQGAAIFLYSKYSSYYILGGSINKPLLGSMNLLIWESMMYFKDKNINRFDFVGARLNPLPGSKIEGIQLFKHRFGSEIKKGFIFKGKLSNKYYLFKLLLVIINFIKNKKSIDIVEEIIRDEKHLSNIRL